MSEPLQVGQRIEKPWGWEEIIYVRKQPSGTAKLLFIKPGQQLSLQLHRGKSEYVKTVYGEARLWLGGRWEPLGVRTYIRAWTVHRLKNASEGELAVVLEESEGDNDDVVRLEDDYGRA